MLPDDPNDQARFFYLAILGVAIASGLFWHYRGRLGSALQSLAIWALIFAGLVIGYGFKDQLLGQLDPGRATMVGGEIALARGSDGHFHAVVTVNGADIRFLVDTGATNIVLSRRDAARAGLDPTRLAYTLPANTANGVVMGAPVRLDRVEFAGHVDRDVPAVVNEGELAGSLLGLGYLDTFSAYRVEGDTLYLRR